MTLNDKAREIKEIANKASEDKKILKEKQIKEAQESLHKIQAELIDLSKLWEYSPTVIKWNYQKNSKQFYCLHTGLDDILQTMAY